MSLVQNGSVAMFRFGWIVLLIAVAPGFMGSVDYGERAAFVHPDSVVSGNSFRIVHAERALTVRIRGVHCGSTDTAATGHLRSMIGGREVLIGQYRADVGSDVIPARVILNIPQPRMRAGTPDSVIETWRDSCDVGRRMIRDGFAVVDTSVGFPELVSYLEIQLDAQIGQRGLWAGTDLVPETAELIQRVRERLTPPQKYERSRRAPRSFYNDPGIPDTVRVESARQVAAGEAFSVAVRFTIDEHLAGISIPLVVRPPVLIFDSVLFRPGVASHVDMNIANVDIFAETGKLLLGTVPFAERHVSPAADSLYCRLFFTVAEDTKSTSVSIGTTEFPPHNTLTFVRSVDGTGHSFVPQFVPGRFTVRGVSSDG